MVSLHHTALTLIRKEQAAARQQLDRLLTETAEVRGVLDELAVVERYHTRASAAEQPATPAVEQKPTPPEVIPTPAAEPTPTPKTVELPPRLPEVQSSPVAWPSKPAAVPIPSEPLSKPATTIPPEPLTAAGRRVTEVVELASPSGPAHRVETPTKATMGDGVSKVVLPTKAAGESPVIDAGRSPRRAPDTTPSVS